MTTTARLTLEVPNLEPGEGEPDTLTQSVEFPLRDDADKADAIVLQHMTSEGLQEVRVSILVTPVEPVFDTHAPFPLVAEEPDSAEA